MATQPKDVKVNHVSIKKEMEEQAQIYVALDPSGHDWKYSIMEAQGIYEEGISYGIGIDFQGKEWHI